MHDDRMLVEARLDRALRDRIRPAKYADVVALSVEAWHAPGEPVPVSEALAAAYEPIQLGDLWGKAWSTSWFRLRGDVPPAWAGHRVEVVLDLGFTAHNPGFQAEALAYDAEGTPIKGIHPRNDYVPIANPARGGERVDLLVEGAANPAIPLPHPTELGDRLTADEAALYRLRRADVAVLDEPVWQLCLDVEVLSELMHELSEHEPRRHEILRALERMLDHLDLHDVSGTAASARAQLGDVLSRPAHASAHRVSAVGHAHIDSAWLWPLRETERKAARTFANVTELARDYPELVFACSQAQQYAWVRDNQPRIFDRIRAAVRDGNWVPVGSMWVEADTNMPGGEALARQIVHGKRFFLDELGVDTQEIWLPDSFGYTAAFPQLAKLAGVRWFLTQKLSWNQSNKMPHHTFWWEGIDGTRIFTHFPPVDTYNCEITASELAHAVHNYADKGGGNTSLAPFGYGDGGGGPTREMLEKARRLNNLEGSPRVVVEKPTAFFERANDEYPDAPVWSGELYLELHRATYTTQAKTKAGNRRSEHLLREAELWSTVAALRAGYPYPYDELDELWKTVLLHQFHDILPGSSIAWVHREARETYERVRLALEALVQRAMDAVGDPHGGMGVANAAPLDRNEVVVVSSRQAASLEPLQKLADGQALAWATVKAGSTARLDSNLPVGIDPVTTSGTVLDNGLLRVEVDADGLLASVYDISADREVLAPGQRGNLLQLHPDHPNNWDAWDIDRHYLHQHTDLVEADSVTLLDDGPLAARVEVRRTFGTSRVTQTYTLTAGVRRLDIDTDVSWHESEKVLKAAFGLDVHADRSSSEIQFGHVHRSTHTNTSWDHARFEICAHRWVHVGEPAYGVAVANDSSYGHDIRRASREGGGTMTTVRLTLLRAPHSPDPRTDQDQHRFAYSLVPGAGIREAVDAGYSLNLPLRVLDNVADGEPVVRLDNPAVRVESVKLADDRSGDVVVRLYESEGDRARTTLRPGFACIGAQTVDLLERPLGDGGNLVDERLHLSLRPFEIVTVRLTPA
jgi:alpha-mannosidase